MAKNTTLTVGTNDIIPPTMVADAAACVSLCYSVVGCIASHFENATHNCHVKHSISMAADADDDSVYYRFCRKTA